MIEIYPNLQIANLRTGTGTETSKASAPTDTKFARLLREAQSPGQSMETMFAKAAERYQVPEKLIKAVAFHESRYRPDVVSSAGAMGVMQLMPGTAAAMGVKNPYDAEQNIMGGAKLLGQLFEKYDGDLKLTLAAYGAGSGSVAKYNGVPPFTETQNFVRDIMSVMGSSDWDGNFPQKSSTESGSSAVQSSSSGFNGWAALNSGTTSTPVHTTASYMNILSKIADFDDFTKADYRLFLAYLLQQPEDTLWGDSQASLL